MIWVLYSVPWSNPTGPETVFGDRWFEEKEGWVFRDIGWQTGTVKYYPGPRPAPDVGPLVGTPDEWLYGLSYERYIAGGYENPHPCVPLPDVGRLKIGGRNTNKVSAAGLRVGGGSEGGVRVLGSAGVKIGGYNEAPYSGSVGLTISGEAANVFGTEAELQVSGEYTYDDAPPYEVTAPSQVSGEYHITPDEEAYLVVSGSHSTSHEDEATLVVSGSHEVLYEARAGLQVGAQEPETEDEPAELVIGGEVRTIDEYDAWLAVGGEAWIIDEDVGMLGEIKIWPISVPPTGWLLCDGQNVSRTTYAELFALLGTSYGNGNGTTTFGLPNFQGRFPIGAGTVGAGDIRSLGEHEGDEDHTITEGELPAHSHNLGVALDGGVVGGNLLVAAGTAITWGINSAGPYARNGAADGKTTNTGGGASFKLIPPFCCVNFIIKH